MLDLYNCAYLKHLIDDTQLLGRSYLEGKWGSPCQSGTNAIASFSECSTAAAVLALSDTTAKDGGSGYNGVNYFPPNCFTDGSLYFNPDGSNTGACTTSTTCICRGGTIVHTHIVFRQSILQIKKRIFVVKK